MVYSCGSSSVIEEDGWEAEFVLFVFFLFGFLFFYLLCSHSCVFVPICVFVKMYGGLQLRQQ